MKKLASRIGKNRHSESDVRPEPRVRHGRRCIGLGLLFRLFLIKLPD